MAWFFVTFRNIPVDPYFFRCFQELSETAVMSYDPLPPTDTIDVYTRSSRRTQIEDPSALRMFFRSLMPNFDPNEQVPDAAEGGAGGAADGK